MNYLILALLLACCVPSALSLKCYQCRKKGNCEDNGKECPSNILFKYDRCSKLEKGGEVGKGCSTKLLCDAAVKVCDKLDNCKASCCEGDLCNASSTVTPTIIVTAVATLMSMAAFLM